MTYYINEFGNNLFVVCALVGVGYLLTSIPGLSAAHRRVVTGWALIFFSVAIQRAYWIIPHKSAPEGMARKPVMLENSFILTIITGIMFAIGMVQFISVTKNLPPSSIAKMAVGILAAAGGLLLIEP